MCGSMTLSHRPPASASASAARGGGGGAADDAGRELPCEERVVRPAYRRSMAGQAKQAKVRSAKVHAQSAKVDFCTVQSRLSTCTTSRILTFVLSYCRHPKLHLGPKSKSAKLQTARPPSPHSTTAGAAAAGGGAACAVAAGQPAERAGSGAAGSGVAGGGGAAGGAAAGRPAARHRATL